MTFDELALDLIDKTNNFTELNGAYKVVSKADVQNAETILRTYYQNVDKKKLDYTNNDAEGIDYMIRFDTPLYNFDLEESIKMNEEYVIEPTYDTKGVTKEDVEKYAELLGLDYDTALRRYKTIMFMDDTNFDRVSRRIHNMFNKEESMNEEKALRKNYKVELYYNNVKVHNWPEKPHKPKFVKYFEYLVDAYDYAEGLINGNSPVTSILIFNMRHPDSFIDMWDKNDRRCVDPDYNYPDRFPWIYGRSRQAKQAAKKRDKNMNVEEAIEKHDTLNPKLWDGNQLKPEVEEKLREIVQKFDDNLKENDVELDVKDICIIGSNANYNYSPDSDIDLHIVADTSVYPDQEDLAMKVYLAYKSLFNNKYDPTINGVEVEIYVEPDAIQANSNGIYSLNDGWLREPEQVDVPQIDPNHVQELIQPYEDRYNNIINSSDATLDDVDNLIDDIYLQRQRSIMKDGEFGDGNICFKEFRNRGYLQNLRDLKVELENKEMSLNTFSESLLSMMGLNEEDEIDLIPELKNYLKVGDKFREPITGEVIEITDIDDDIVTYLSTPVDEEPYSVPVPRNILLANIAEYYEPIKEDVNEALSDDEFAKALEVNNDNAQAESDELGAIFDQELSRLGVSVEDYDNYLDMYKRLDDKGRNVISDKIKSFDESLNESAEAIGNGFEFSFPNVENTLDVYLHWEGIFGYTDEILEFAEAGYDALDAHLNDEGIFGYTDKIYEIVNENTAYCRDMDESDFFDICRELYLDPMTAFEYDDLTESLEEDFEGYEEINSTIHDSNGNVYQLFRKILKDDRGNIIKGLWAAAPIEMGEVLKDQMFEITYDQARGFEPLPDDHLFGLKKELGRKLLPKHEDLNEDVDGVYTLVLGYGDDEWDDGYDSFRGHLDTLLKYADKEGYYFDKNDLQRLQSGKEISIDSDDDMGYITSNDEGGVDLDNPNNDYLFMNKTQLLDELRRAFLADEEDKWHNVYDQLKYNFMSYGDDRYELKKFLRNLKKEKANDKVKEDVEKFDSLGAAKEYIEDNKDKYEKTLLTDEGDHYEVKTGDDLPSEEDDDPEDFDESLNEEILANTDVSFDLIKSMKLGDSFRVRPTEKMLKERGLHDESPFEFIKFEDGWHTFDEGKDLEMSPLDDEDLFRSINNLNGDGYFTYEPIKNESLKEAKGVVAPGKKFKHGDTIIEITEPTHGIPGGDRVQFQISYKGKIVDNRSTDSYQTLARILDANGYEPIDESLNEDLSSDAKKVIFDTFEHYDDGEGWDPSDFTWLIDETVNNASDTVKKELLSKKQEVMSYIGKLATYEYDGTTYELYPRFDESLNEGNNDRLKEILSIPEVKEHVDYIINNAEYDKYTGDYDYVDITCDTDFDEIANANGISDEDRELLYNYMQEQVYNESLNEAASNLVYVELKDDPGTFINKQIYDVDDSDFLFTKDDEFKALFNSLTWKDDLQELLDKYADGYSIDDFSVYKHFDEAYDDNIYRQAFRDAMDVESEGQDFYAHDIEMFAEKYGLDFNVADRVMKKIRMGLDWHKYFDENRAGKHPEDPVDWSFLDESDDYLGHKSKLNPTEKQIYQRGLQKYRIKTKYGTHIASCGRWESLDDVKDAYKYDHSVISITPVEEGLLLDEEDDMKVEKLEESEVSLEEDTVKQDGKWVNKGDEGTHGEFNTKKEADDQRKAMFANGYHEDLNEEADPSDPKAKALAEFEDVDLEDIDQEEDGVYLIGDSLEYFVGTEEEAHARAVEEVKGLFDDMGLEAFTPQFQKEILMNCIDEDAADEFVESELDYFRNDEPDEDMVNYLENLTDKLQYVEDTLGPDTFAEWAKDKIDLDAMAEEAIKQDGEAHFIAFYDGNEIDLGNGLFAYRMN